MTFWCRSGILFWWHGCQKHLEHESPLSIGNHLRWKRQAAKVVCVCVCQVLDLLSSDEACSQSGCLSRELTLSSLQKTKTNMSLHQSYYITRSNERYQFSHVSLNDGTVWLRQIQASLWCQSLMFGLGNVVEKWDHFAAGCYPQPPGVQKPCVQCTKFSGPPFLPTGLSKFWDNTWNTRRFSLWDGGSFGVEPYNSCCEAGTGIGKIPTVFSIFLLASSHLCSGESLISQIHIHLGVGIRR